MYAMLDTSPRGCYNMVLPFDFPSAGGAPDASVWLAWLTFLCVLAPSAVGDDWPQWLGPKRDSVWREKGIVDRFPQQGLHSPMASAGGVGVRRARRRGRQVFVIDYLRRSGDVTNNPGGPDRLEGTERVLCLDAGTGKLIWKHDYDRPYAISFGGGPRCTPTVDGQLVYALGAEGNLSCLDAQTGKLVWSKDFVKDYGAETPFWGVAAHPLVDGDLLFCVVGGPGSVAVAFDKRTGREVWRALSAEQQGYCPPTMIEHGGRKQLIIWHGESINSLDPPDGPRLLVRAAEAEFRHVDHHAQAIRLLPAGHRLRRRGRAAEAG